MNILIAINRRFIFPAKTLIRSISENCKDEISLFVSHIDLMPSDIKGLNRFIKGLNKNKSGKIKLSFIFIDNDTNNIFLRASHGRFSVETFFRIAALYLLPEDVEKILYIDSDTVVNQDLRELYEEDVSKECFAAVKDPINAADLIWVERFLESFQMSGGSVYINAGVLLINVKNFTSAYSLDDMSKSLDSCYDKLEYCDQDLLNIMFERKIKVLSDCRYNYLLLHNNMDLKQPTEVNPLIYHFIGSVKPWHWRYNNVHSDEFWKYARMNKAYVKYFLVKLKRTARSVSHRARGIKD